jgi:hypothetical protein
MTLPTAPSVLDRLAADLDGTLVRPVDPGWDNARLAWQLAVDQRPAAVVVSASERDVQLVLGAADQLGLRVAPQATGHNAAPLGDLDDAVLLKTSAMRGVHIDPIRSLARVEAGALWMDVTSAAGEHGMAALAGSADDVGVVGYTLGGGLSWRDVLPHRPGRRGAPSVVAMAAVSSRHRDVRRPGAAHAATARRTRAIARPLVRRRRGGLPARRRASQRAPGAAAGAGPAMDTFQRTRVGALSKLHMDPERPVPGHGHGMLLGDFDAAAIDEFGRVGLATTSLLSLELRHLGGALTPGHMIGGAVDGLDASFALFAVGITPDAAAAHAVQDDLAAVAHAMASWSTGGCYLNFAEDRQPGATFFGAPAYRRLEQVKAIYDPADLIRANHPIHPRRS